MIYVTGCGGKDAGLNFKVVGGTTQPSAPSENTIWVNTDTEISEWVFAAEQPASPTAGMVWIQTSSSATAHFNTLKKNNITVYPVSCMQYLDNAWVSKTAKTYQDGAWKEWKLYLYKSGDECVDVTGGWQGRAWAPTSDFETQLPTITRTATYISAKKTTGSGYNFAGVLETVNDIDLTGFKTLYLDHVVEKDNSSWSALRICDRTATYSQAGEYCSANLSNNNTRTTISVDISNVNRLADIALEVRGQASPVVTLTMYNMWLE